MPEEDHAHMLGAQFLASALRPSQVSHTHLTAPLGPCRMKHTITTQYASTVLPFLKDGIMPKQKYKQTIDQIHTDAVARVVDKLNPNPILETKPPAIDKSETNLPVPSGRLSLSCARATHPSWGSIVIVMPSTQSADSIGTLSGTSSVTLSTPRLSAPWTSGVVLSNRWSFFSLFLPSLLSFLSILFFLLLLLLHLIPFLAGLLCHQRLRLVSPFHPLSPLLLLFAASTLLFLLHVLLRPLLPQSASW